MKLRIAGAVNPPRRTISLERSTFIFLVNTSYETSEEWIRFYFFDRIYRIDGIFFAFGEEPFRPKAVLSR